MSVTLHTTHGELKIEVFCSAVPQTAYNFLALCASAQYDGSPFHRLIPGFMIQGGSPPDAGPKVSTSVYEDGLFGDEFRPTLRHNARGIVSMANKGPSTNGSQFFVLFAPAPHLDGKNTVFGRVIEGAEEGGTLDIMESIGVADGKEGKKGRPREDIVIQRVTVHANPVADEG